MDFELITLFPDETATMAGIGVTGRALQACGHRLRCWNPRDHATGAYRRVDDRPYGGGPGMVMLAEPLARCLAQIRDVRARVGDVPLPVIHLSPQGRRLDQAGVRAFAAGPGAILLCGRYEAIDQRFLDAEVDEEVSIGDFIVSGGELPALVLVDAVLRLLPGTLNDPDSADAESFSAGLLDHPHYTRPENYGGVPVPAVLLSGNHAEIARWRRAQAEAITARKRPDLLDAAASCTSAPGESAKADRQASR